METHPAVRPFRVDVPEEDLDDRRVSESVCHAYMRWSIYLS
jgi:hypothetical protein